MQISVTESQKKHRHLLNRISKAMIDQSEMYIIIGLPNEGRRNQIIQNHIPRSYTQTINNRGGAAHFIFSVKRNQWSNTTKKNKQCTDKKALHKPVLYNKEKQKRKRFVRAQAMSEYGRERQHEEPDGAIHYMPQKKNQCIESRTTRTTQKNNKTSYPIPIFSSLSGISIADQKTG